MPETHWKNTYDLSEEQYGKLESAEDFMDMMQLDKAETLLLSMLDEDSKLVPVLNNLGHLYGRHLSDFEKAIEYYDKVLEIEPDNAWAMDERRRYRRYATYD